MRQEFRCPSRLHGVLTDNLIEVRCRTKHCKSEDGEVVLHYFDPATTKLVRTERFREPAALFGNKEEE